MQPDEEATKTEEMLSAERGLAVKLLGCRRRYPPETLVPALMMALGVIVSETAEDPFAMLEAIHVDLQTGLSHYTAAKDATERARANGPIVDAETVNNPYPEAEGAGEAEGSGSAVDA